MPAALPELDDEVTVPAEAVAGFAERGHTVLRALASPAEVAAYRPAILEAAPRSRYDHRPLAERDTYGRAFVQMLNVWRHDERVRTFVFARRFAAAAAALLGVPAVRLYRDQALFKEPGGGLTPWHQDQFYWPLDSDRTITLWMPLVAIDDAMGPMVFASCSQRLGNLGDHPIGDASEQAFGRVVEQQGFAVEGHAPFAPGDATFHAGWTLHGAHANETDTLREVMTITYFADGARVSALDHPARRFDRDAWLAGCEPGEPAAGPLNPVLFRSAPPP